MIWYVIDTRTNEIVNAIESSRRPDRILATFDNEHLRLDPNPPMWMLQQYRYWNERP